MGLEAQSRRLAQPVGQCQAGRQAGTGPEPGLGLRQRDALSLAAWEWREVFQWGLTQRCCWGRGDGAPVATRGVWAFPAPTLPLAGLSTPPLSKNNSHTLRVLFPK